MRVVDDGVGGRPVHACDGFKSRELQQRGCWKLRLRAAVRVMHQLVRGASLATCFGRVRLPLCGVQINVICRRFRMTDGFMERSPASNHRLYNQTHHQERQKELATQGAYPMGVTAFHKCGV